MAPHLIVDLLLHKNFLKIVIVSFCLSMRLLKLRKITSLKVNQIIGLLNSSKAVIGIIMTNLVDSNFMFLDIMVVKTTIRNTKVTYMIYPSVN